MYYFDKKKKSSLTERKKTKPVLRIRDQTKQQWVTGGRQREASHADRRQPSIRSLKILGGPACLLPCPASRAASCVPERREHASSCTHIGTPKGMFSLHLHTHTTSLTLRKEKPPPNPSPDSLLENLRESCASQKPWSGKYSGELQASFLWAHNTHLLSAETLTDIFSWGRGVVLMGFGNHFTTEKLPLWDQESFSFWSKQSNDDQILGAPESSRRLMYNHYFSAFKDAFLPPMYTCNLLAPNHGDWNLLPSPGSVSQWKLLTASWLRHSHCHWETLRNVIKGTWFYKKGQWGVIILGSREGISNSCFLRRMRENEALR